MDEPSAPPPGTATTPGYPLPPGIPFEAAAFSKVMVERGHGGFVGLRYHAHGDDWIELALPWRADLVGDAGTGVLASGPIISMLDTATSLAVQIRRGLVTRMVTIDLRVDYMRAAVPGRTVVARCECYQERRRVAFVRGLAHDGDGGDPVAHVAGTFMLFGAEE